jgi:hypothetical protein
MRPLPTFAAVLSLAFPVRAAAQRTVAHDTLSEGTPVGVTCGFCAGEAFGVVFRELPPPARGIEPFDFPLELRAVQVALASVRTTGAPPSFRCEGSTSGGTVAAEISIWAGTTPPSGDIRSFPVDGPWGDEQLVWAAEAPIELSLAEAEGSSRYALMLNTIRVAGEDGGPLWVPVPRTYLRVQVVLPAGGSSTACDAMRLPPPGGVPVRDDDGRIAPERSFIYAGGVGYLWNEAAGVAGDWAIRLQIVPSAPPPPDGGSAHVDRDGASGGLDAGTREDSGDGGTEPPDRGGCGCRLVGGTVEAGATRRLATLGLLVSIALALRRRRARRRDRTG